VASSSSAVVTLWRSLGQRWNIFFLITLLCDYIPQWESTALVERIGQGSRDCLAVPHESIPQQHPHLPSPPPTATPASGEDSVDSVGHVTEHL
jgi:hypothetical protein